MNHKQATEKYEAAANLRQDELIQHWQTIEHDDHGIWNDELHPRHDFVKYGIVFVIWISLVTAGLYFGNYIDIQFFGE